MWGSMTTWFTKPISLADGTCFSDNVEGSACVAGQYGFAKSGVGLWTEALGKDTSYSQPVLSFVLTASSTCPTLSWCFATMIRCNKLHSICLMNFTSKSTTSCVVHQAILRRTASPQIRVPSLDLGAPRKMIKTCSSMFHLGSSSGTHRLSRAAPLEV